MRWITDSTRRFSKRPFYDDDELEYEAHSAISDFLLEKNGCVDYPISTDDLTLLIEQHADLDIYADLSELGCDVEGVTSFSAGKRPFVRIRESLTVDPKRQNRLRTTLAHEFGHVRLHNILFQQEAPGIPLFTQIRASEQICKREHIATALRTDWIEFQAGVICTALLAPKRAVLNLVSATTLDRDSLLQLVASTFGISNEAAWVRLSRLGVIGDPRQQRML